MLDISVIIDKDDKELAIKTIDLLQYAFLSPNDNDLELLNILNDLQQLKTYYQDVSLLQTENIKEFIDKEWIITEVFVHVTTDLEKVFLKLDYLKIKYPENENITFVEKAIAQDLQEHIDNGGKVKNKDFLQYKANHILNKSNNKSNHKVLKITQQLLEKIEHYSQDFNALSDLAQFWNENSHFFSTNPMDRSQYVENDSFAVDTNETPNRFTFKDDITRKKIYKEDKIIIEQIQQVQQYIFEKLFTHFTLFPQEHKNFTEQICPFFSFTDWSQSENKYYLIEQWTQDNIEVLSENKDYPGYDYYIENLFKINLHKMFVETDFSQSQFIPKSTETIEFFLEKKLNYDQLFENNTVGLPQNIQLLFSEMQSMTKEQFEKKLEESIINRGDDELLDKNYNNYKNTIRNFSRICLLNKVADIPVPSTVVKKLKI